MTQLLLTGPLIVVGFWAVLIALWSWHIGSGLWATRKTRWSERGGRQGGHSSPRWNRPSRSGFRDSPLVSYREEER